MIGTCSFGACCEHSHAIALWVHLSRLLDLGSVVEVEGQMKMINTEGLYYDEETSIQVKTEKGILGSIKQDVKTMPAIKMARIEGDEGYIEWFANFEEGRDLVKWSSKGGAEQSKIFPKFPNLVFRLMTLFSLKESIGGFVTWLKFCLK